MRAALSEDKIARVLRENFVVALEPHPAHSNVAFGIRAYIFAPDGRRIMEYWWGTGPINATEEIHRTKVNEVADALREAGEAWERMKADAPREY